MTASRPTSVDDLLAEQGWMRRLARRLVLDEATADDLVQQAWVDLLRAPPTPGPGLRGFLATVLRRLAAKHDRSASRRVERERRATATAAAMELAIPSPADLAAEVDRQRELVECVLALDEPYRETVLLRWYRDLAPAAIATHLGIPVGTVETRLKRAHARLREELTRHEGGDARRWAIAWMPIAIHAPVESAAAAGITLTLGALVMSKGFVVAMATVLVAITAAIYMTDSSDRARDPDRTNANILPKKAAAFPVDSATQNPDYVRRDVAPSEEDVARTDAASSDPESQCVVRVLDAAGNPIAGATLVIEPRGSEVPEPRQTDARGEVALPRTVEPVVAWVFGPSHALSRNPLSLAEPIATLTMPRGRVIEGRVEIDGAVPRRPVTVFLHPIRPLPLREVAPPALFDWMQRRGLGNSMVCTVDPEGRFYCDGLPEGFEGRLDANSTYADADDRSHRWSDLVVAPRSDIVFTLVSRPILSGRILEADGRPASGANLDGTFTTEPTVDDTTSTPGAVGGIAMTAQADGCFEMPIVYGPSRAVDRIELRVSNAAGASVARFLEGPFRGRIELGDLTLVEAQRCRFRAVDEAGVPLPSAVAFLVDDPQRRSEPTDASGESVFLLPLRKTASATSPSIYVFLPGRELGVFAVSASDAIDVVTLRPCTRLVVQLEPADIVWPRRLLLVVEAKLPSSPPDLDAQSALAMLSILTPSGGVERPPYHLDGVVHYEKELDERGTCTLERLLPYVEWNLRLTGRTNRPLAESKITLAPGVETYVTLLPPRPRNVAGVVTDVAGRPARGAKVAVTWRISEETGGRADATTDGDGHYSLSDVFGTPIEIVATLEDHAPARRCEVAVPNEGAIVDLILKPGRAVVVRVLDAGGAAIPGASVRGRLPSETSPSSTPHVEHAHSDGNAYRFEGLPLGRIDAEVEIHDVKTPFVIEPSVAEVTVRLPPR